MAIERLLTGDQTLFGFEPERVAVLLQNKLNQLEPSCHIEDVAAIPDYHTFGSDGGVKDIFIRTSRKSRRESPTEWHTALLRGEGTMYKWPTDRIQTLLENKLGDLERQHLVVKAWIALTDHHQAGLFKGISGFDGLKDMIICYHPRRSRRRAEVSMA